MLDRQLVLDLFRIRQVFMRPVHFDFNNDMLRSEFFVLQALSRNDQKGHLTVGDIACQLNQSNPSISRTIKGLGEKDWIERHSDPDDRRTTYICISNKGRENYNRVVDSFVQNTWDALKDIPKEDLEKFIEIGKKITEATQNFSPSKTKEE